MPTNLLSAKPTSFEQNRPIYPNVPYSPYGSPFGSPRNRRRVPLRESRRISIEQTGSFLQLNQYKLMDQIGQVCSTATQYIPLTEYLIFIAVINMKIIIIILKINVFMNAGLIWFGETCIF